MSDVDRALLSFPRVAAARGIPGVTERKRSGFFARGSHARENDRQGEARLAQDQTL